MHPKPYITSVIVVGLLVTVAMLMPGNASGKAYVADIVMVEGAQDTFQVRDWNGQLVEVEVPSRSIRDVQMHHGEAQRMQPATAEADKTVRATVTSVDEQNNSITVRTQYGQTLVLVTSTEGLYIGEQLVLVAAW